MAWRDDTDQQSNYAANETYDESDPESNSDYQPSHYDRTYERDHERNSDYQPSHYDSDDELESLTKEDRKPPAVIVPEVQAGCDGTAASITEIIYSCFFGSAACSMRYNKQSLTEINGVLCAGPLITTSLGMSLRVKPFPSPNRALDVNLCYLRIAFKQHKLLLPRTILSNSRCKASDIDLTTLSDMMFQTIILRFTGRIYQFEQYHRHVQNLQTNTTAIQSNQRIPLCNQSQHFLDYIELSLQSTKKLSMMSWVSRQHDGAIAPHLIKNYANFRVFVERHH
jgi:hypothetical protein